MKLPIYHILLFPTFTKMKVSCHTPLSFAKMKVSCHTPLYIFILILNHLFITIGSFYAVLLLEWGRDPLRPYLLWIILLQAFAMILSMITIHSNLFLSSSLMSFLFSIINGITIRLAFFDHGYNIETSILISFNIIAFSLFIPVIFGLKFGKRLKDKSE